MIKIIFPELTSSTVDCGMHTAETCAKCILHPALGRFLWYMWCNNGECTWDHRLHICGDGGKTILFLEIRNINIKFLLQYNIRYSLVLIYRRFSRDFHYNRRKYSNTQLSTIASDGRFSEFTAAHKKQNEKPSNAATRKRY